MSRTIIVYKDEYKYLLNIFKSLNVENINCSNNSQILNMDKLSKIKHEELNIKHIPIYKLNNTISMTNIERNIETNTMTNNLDNKICVKTKK